MAWIRCVEYGGMAFPPLQVMCESQGGRNCPGRFGTYIQEQLYQLDGRDDNIALRLRLSILKNRQWIGRVSTPVVTPILRFFIFRIHSKSCILHCTVLLHVHYQPFGRYHRCHSHLALHWPLSFSPHLPCGFSFAPAIRLFKVLNDDTNHHGTASGKISMVYK